MVANLVHHRAKLILFWEICADTAFVPVKGGLGLASPEFSFILYNFWWKGPDERFCAGCRVVEKVCQCQTACNTTAALHVTHKLHT